jgi:tRNA U55 pseudouridine synthase TruB
VTSLRRTAIAEFSVNDAIAVGELQQHPHEHIIPVHEMMARFPSYTASDTELNQIVHGNSIRVDAVPHHDIICIFSQQNELVAVAKPGSPHTLQPVKVFRS